MKKKPKNLNPYSGQGAKKLILTMKLALIVMLLTAFQVSANVYSQMTVDLDVQNKPIRDVLKAIEQQSQVRFFYSDDLLAMNDPIDLKADDRNILSVLNEIFLDSPLTYKTYDNNLIVIVPKELLQQKAITGKVTDSQTGEGLPGVNVTVEGTIRGAITDIYGKYNIEVPPGEVVLVYSFIGYKTEKVTAEGRDNIDVQLNPDIFALKDVVVVAYGTTKQSDLINAVSSISPEKILDRPVSNVQQSLQGLTSGLTILDVGGAPGRSEAMIRVRGVTTFNVDGPSSTYGGFSLSKNNPLTIVDGIEQSLTSINPDDIESISILKDAASTAMYGSRATNGLIIVTTKRAKENAILVNYSGYYAIQEGINHPKMMDIESYMRMQAVAYINSGAALPAKFTEESIQTWVNATDRERYPLPNTWYETVMKRAPQTNHSISIAGGTDLIKSRLSARFMDQQGIAPNYNQKLAELKINNDLRASKNILLSADITYRINNSKTPVVEPWQNILHGSLWAVPKYSDGTYGLSSQGNNPLMFAEISGISARKDDHLYANLKGEWEIIKGLKFSTQFGLRTINTYAKNHANAYVNRDKTTGITKTVANNTLTEVRNTFYEYTLTNLLTYEKTVDQHNLRILGGYSQNYNKATYLNAYRERFYNNDIQSINQGTNDGTKSNSGYDEESALRSYFGRINYSYQGRYLFEVNGRYDGSSKFVGNKTYAFFPSVSAGWRISEESFWEGIRKTVDNLKIRGSWGVTGNQVVPSYQYYNALVLQNYTFGGLPVTGYRLTNAPFPGLGWESTTQKDIGLDIGFLKGRVSLTADYYDKVTNDILLRLGIPATVGLIAPYQNAGTVRNSGFEFEINYRDELPVGLSYSISGNLSINKNEVTDLKGTGPYITGSDNYPRYIVKVGLPVNALWGYTTDGLFQTTEEVAGYPTYAANSKPGDVKYVDLNKDGKIDANDMTMIGNVIPRYTFGLSTDFSYKNFDLSMLWQGVADVDTRLGGALSDHGNFEAFVHEIVTNDYWTPENPTARFARPLKFDFRNGITSDRTIIDGSYLRLKNIQLGYSIPQSLSTKIKIEKIRFYIAGTNLLTFSELNEWDLDPEVEPGVAVYYPQVKLYTIGINVDF